MTEARANAVAAGAQGPAESAAAENALTGTLRSLFAVVENYPELKANQNVLELQEQLTTTENQIGFARQHYNAVVLDYNTAIATFPNVLIAGPLGFRAARVLRRRARGVDRSRRSTSDFAPTAGTAARRRPPPVRPASAAGTAAVPLRRRPACRPPAQPQRPSIAWRPDPTQAPT